MVSYAAGYICFIKTPKSIVNPTNSLEDEYIDNCQIDKKLVNQLKKNNFELNQADKNYRLAAV